MKDSITTSERWQLIGLMSLDKKQVAAMKEIQSTIEELIGEAAGDGRVCDAMYGYGIDDPVTSVSELLEACKIQVED